MQISNDCETPVAFIVFNRPEVTARVFAALRAARPSTLFVIADGPRPHVATDAAACVAVRKVVAAVDWPCRLLQKLAPTNLGLRQNVSDGLAWVFEQTEEAIILEDDCLPDPSFFPFCEELLERYQNDTRIALIAGTSPDSLRSPPAGDESSYRFSRYPHIWGWATWRRAWQGYDDYMTPWPALRDNDWLAGRGLTPSAANFWRRQFDDCLTDRRDALNTWDMPWTFACWKNEMLSIVPRENLVENLGFGPDANHTKRMSPLATLRPGRMEFPLTHPPVVAADEAADRWVQDHIFEGATRMERLFWKLRLPIPIWCVRRMQRLLAA